jgi:antitoxin (DNA-binding transcriptional repressor) of toxin-antitoxin stability system
MRKAITVTEILRNFSDYINRVSYRGESFILTRGRLKVAELKPTPKGCTSLELKEYLNQAPHLTATEQKSFGQDLINLKRSTKKEKLKDPWA